MSIIHDALKKVQQGLSPKPAETPVVPAAETKASSEYIYASTPAVETLTQSVQKISGKKLPVKSKVRSTLANTCVILITAAITIASIEYIYQQFQNNIPQVQRLAKKSFYALIHKKEIPDFKTRAPEDLKPLAKLTINPTASLNIHGIMANASGNLALINDQVYQAGDEVDGAKIVKIDLDSITVNVNGTEKTIPVNN